MRLLRALILIIGLGVVGLSGAVEYGLRRRDARVATVSSPTGASSAADRDWVAPDSGLPSSSRVARVQKLLGAVGVGIAVFGGYVLLRDVAPSSYLGLGIWLAAAIVLHDGVLVPGVSLLRGATHHVGRRLPVTAVRLLEAGFLVGAVITLIAVPEIYAQHLGTLNPTVLPGAYGRSLLITWLVIITVTALVVAVVTRRDRRKALAGVRIDS